MPAAAAADMVQLVSAPDSRSWGNAEDPDLDLDPMDDEEHLDEEHLLGGGWSESRSTSRRAGHLVDLFRFDGDKLRQAEHRGRLGHLRLICLAAYWFGFSFLSLPMLTVILPYQVKELVRTENGGVDNESAVGSALAKVFMLGSLFSIPVGPVFGSISDASRNPIGRRRPFMILGLLMGTAALLVMANSGSLMMFGFGFMLLCSANNMIIAPYSALVPDLVPVLQRGVASGWLGIMSILGSVLGASLGYSMHSLGLPGTYAVLILIHGLAMSVSVFFVLERAISPHDRRAPPIPGCGNMLASFAAPFRNHDFRVVFYSRFLIQLGIFTVQEFLSFYLAAAFGNRFEVFGIDLGITEPEQAVSLLFGPVLFGAFVSSMLSGVVSDALGGKRKAIIYASGALMTLASLMFALTRNFSLDLVLGLLFGLGFGAFSVMDWALVTDVLPNPNNFATDMSLWALSLLIPQLLASGIAGTLFDWFQAMETSEPKELNLGCTVVFLLAAVYFVAGTWYIKAVEHVH